MPENSLSTYLNLSTEKELHFFVAEALNTINVERFQVIYEKTIFENDVRLLEIVLRNLDRMSYHKVRYSWFWRIMIHALYQEDESLSGQAARIMGKWARPLLMRHVYQRLMLSKDSSFKVLLLRQLIRSGFYFFDESLIINSEKDKQNFQKWLMYYAINVPQIGEKLRQKLVARFEREYQGLSRDQKIEWSTLLVYLRKRFNLKLKHWNKWLNQFRDVFPYLIYDIKSPSRDVSSANVKLDSFLRALENPREPFPVQVTYVSDLFIQWQEEIENFLNKKAGETAEAIHFVFYRLAQIQSSYTLQVILDYLEKDPPWNIKRIAFLYLHYYPLDDPAQRQKLRTLCFRAIGAGEKTSVQKNAAMCLIFHFGEEALNELSVLLKGSNTSETERVSGILRGVLANYEDLKPYTELHGAEILAIEALFENCLWLTKSGHEKEIVLFMRMAVYLGRPSLAERIVSTIGSLPENVYTAHFKCLCPLERQEKYLRELLAKNDEQLVHRFLSVFLESLKPKKAKELLFFLVEKVDVAELQRFRVFAAYLHLLKSQTYTLSLEALPKDISLFNLHEKAAMLDYLDLYQIEQVIHIYHQFLNSGTIRFSKLASMKLLLLRDPSILFQVYGHWLIEDRGEDQLLKLLQKISLDGGQLELQLEVLLSEDFVIHRSRLKKIFQYLLGRKVKNETRDLIKIHETGRRFSKGPDSKKLKDLPAGVYKSLNTAEELILWIEKQSSENMLDLRTVFQAYRFFVSALLRQVLIEKIQNNDNTHSYSMSIKRLFKNGEELGHYLIRHDFPSEHLPGRRMMQALYETLSTEGAKELMGHLEQLPDSLRLNIVVLWMFLHEDENLGLQQLFTWPEALAMRYRPMNSLFVILNESNKYQTGNGSDALNKLVAVREASLSWLYFYLEMSTYSKSSNDLRR